MSITINGTTGISGVDGSSTTPAFQGTDTDTGLFYSANTVSVSAGGSKVATINAYGIGLGTGSPSSGIGITFPATQSASSDANTLDDYEEGTWTVTIGDGTNNYTANFVTGIYTKIGNLVTAAGLITWTSIGSAGASQLRLSLPFSAVNVNFARFGAALGLIAGFDTVAGTKQIMANLDQGANYLTFYQINDNASATALPSNAQSATGQVQFTISYTV